MKRPEIRHGDAVLWVGPEGDRSGLVLSVGLEEVEIEYRYWTGEREQWIRRWVPVGELRLVIPGGTVSGHARDIGAEGDCEP